MTGERTSDQSLIWITGPYSADGSKIQIRRAVVREGLGRLTETTVEFLWDRLDEELSTFLGKRMTIHLKGEGESGQDRQFIGTIVSVETLGVRRGKAHYVAEVRPKMWTLTLRRNSRVFQEMTTEQIVKAILEEHGVAEYEFKLNGTYKARTTCVQYRETDFDFVSRLIEQDGIYYHFDHSGTEDEKPVFCDGSGSHGPVPDDPTLPYIARDQSESQRGDHVAEWAKLQQIQPNKVTLSDWDYFRPGTNTQKNNIRKGSYSLEKGEVFDHPGMFVATGREADSSHDDDALGKHRARVWMESLAARFDLRRGAGTVRKLGTGLRFKIAEEEESDDADQLDDANQEFLVIDAVHYLQEQGGYEEVALRRDLVSDRVELPDGMQQDESNEGKQKKRRTLDMYASTFTAMKVEDTFRSPPLTAWPRIVGPQTATVVGPSGKEIHSDKFGRIRVRFHWSRKEDGTALPDAPTQDEHASCWLRVVTPWAGEGWGFVALPRVGMEAVVEFEEGHPDRPICTGMVYNKTKKQPYDYQSDTNWTQLGLRSNSSPGGGGFNEFMFDDKKDSERVYFQAQKDYEGLVKNDSTETIEHDKALTVENDSTTKINNNYTHTVKQNETREVSQGNLSVDVKAGTATIKAAQKIELICGQSKITMTPDKITVSALTLDMSGSIQAKLSSDVATDVLGSAMVKVQGGLVKIN